VSDLAIFLAGAYTSVLCVLFVVLTIREVRGTEREQERRAQASPSGSPSSPPSAAGTRPSTVTISGPQALGKAWKQPPRSAAE
jgi:hypothetical protein